MTFVRTTWLPVLMAVAFAMAFTALGGIAVRQELLHPGDPSRLAWLLSPALFNSFFLVLVAVSAFWAGFRGVRRGYSLLWIGLCGGAIPLGIVTFFLLVTFVTTGRSDFDELLAWEAVVKTGSCFVLAILSSLAARAFRGSLRA